MAGGREGGREGAAEEGAKGRGGRRLVGACVVPLLSCTHRHRHTHTNTDTHITHCMLMDSEPGTAVSEGSNASAVLDLEVHKGALLSLPPAMLRTPQGLAAALFQKRR